MHTKFINDVPNSSNKNWNGTNKENPTYRKWRDMKYRVLNHKNYYTVKIDSSWYIYSNFAKDISNLKNFNKPNYELDKDLYFLINKNIPKVYSKDTCYFLPKPINLVLRSFPTKSLQTKLKLKNLINIFKNDLDLNVIHMLEELTK